MRNLKICLIGCGRAGITQIAKVFGWTCEVIE